MTSLEMIHLLRGGVDEFAEDDAGVEFRARATRQKARDHLDAHATRENTGSLEKDEAQWGVEGSSDPAASTKCLECICHSGWFLP